jgi:hypothetical protein
MTERSKALVPVADSGLTVDSEVLRSWTIKDSHGHVQAKAEVDGQHLKVSLVGQELRLSKLQMQALLELGSRWQRYWDESAH